MSMKKLIESMDAIEGPAGMPPMGAPEMDKGNPVTMNVSMNASGKEHVEDLIDMMKNAGMDAKEVSPDHMPMRMDMERLRDLVDEPGDEDPNEELEPVDEIDTEEGYDNEPDARYGDTHDAIPDGNDLNRKKKAYAATQDGDNAMAVEAIKATLMAALQEKKKPDADGDGVPDWADKKPGKDDNADKKKGSKPKKGEVPPQFKKK
jgi:hypothetical protein